MVARRRIIMKFKVKYYDYDSDKVVEKDCFDFDYEEPNKSFYFTPVDNPVKSYKSVVIDSPVAYIGYNNGKLKILVEGYQYTKSGGYWKTKTIINSVYED
jgi:hypothetical protein